MLPPSNTLSHSPNCIRDTDMFLTYCSTTKPITLDGNNDPSASQTVKQKWNSLSHTTQIAIAAAVGGVALIALFGFAFFCIRQRRAGRRERALEDAEWEKSSAELMAYRAAMEKQQQQRTPVMGGQTRGAGGRNSWMFGGQKGFQRF
jgi:flagellar biosynthesis/type III secretory pathway M-ring protein FliF/YscJ